MLQARQQLENAHLRTANAFQVQVPSAPPSKKQEIGAIITEKISGVLKSPRSRIARPYLHTQRQKFGTVCVHGVGSQFWEDQWKINPYFAGIADVLIPTDTEITMEELGNFAIRRRMSPGNLYRKTIGAGDKVDPGWDLEVVREILDCYKDVNTTQTNWNWSQNPEKMQELLKENRISFDRDSVPKVGLIDFYYQGEEDEPCWYRCMILDTDTTETKPAQDPMRFVYKRKDKFADTLDHIGQFNFADGNTSAPYTYHAIRGLGYILFDTLHLMNRARCQFAQRVFDDMMHLFSVTDPADRSRLDQIYFGLRYGIMPEGLRMIGEKEKGDFDPQKVEMLMAGFKQLLGESTAPYNQELDTGTSKERTAFEVQALISQGTKLTSSILNLSYDQEVFGYQEICRRLTIPNSPDFIAKKFQNDLREEGVPDKFINSERWEIQPERVLGGGNQQMEMAQAQGLYEMLPQLNPEAQQRVLNKKVFALTHDPKEAELLAPTKAGPKITDSIHDAQLAFGSLMRGTKVDPKAGLNPIETVETILGLMATEIQRIKATGGMGTPQDVMGLMNAATYAGGFIKQLAQDKAEKQRVKQYGDILGQMTNDMKAFAQRQQEQAQAAAKQNGSQMDPETMMKLQGQMAEMKLHMQEMQFKLQAKEQTHQQKLAQKDQDFQAAQQRKNAETLGKIHRETVAATAMSAVKARAEAKKAGEAKFKSGTKVKRAKKA